jgi:hypothetical protein
MIDTAEWFYLVCIATLAASLAIMAIWQMSK